MSDKLSTLDIHQSLSDQPESFVTPSITVETVKKIVIQSVYSPIIIFIINSV